MTPSDFRFSLQRLLGLRKLAELDAGVELATARRAEDEARQERDVLVTQRAEARDALLPAAGTRRVVSAMKTVALLMERIDRQARNAGEAVANAEHDVHERRQHLNDAVKDRRILDRLRERQHEQWHESGLRAEREVMDDFARSAFIASSNQTSSSAD